MTIVLGVDGGGTRTRAVLTDESGNLLGFGTAGPSNYHNVGVETAAANLAAATNEAWQRSNQEPRPADAAFFGLGSIVSPEDREVIRRIAQDRSLCTSPHLGVDHDLRIALAGGLAGRAGMVLVVGTGSACYGRTASGRDWRAGGWGPVMADEGSAYWLGREALIAMVRDFDGRGPSTILRHRVLAALELTDIQKIMHRVDAAGITRREMGLLAQLVTDAAADDDAVAKLIIERACAELSLMVKAVVTRLTFDVDPIPITASGGLTAAESTMMKSLSMALKHRVPQCELVGRELPPVLGAAYLALASANIEISTAVLDRLKGIEVE